MRIGELARRVGVNIQTLRFYEREGLLRKPPRTAKGYRVYSATDFERLRFIRLCQEVGFTIVDIRSVLETHRNLAAANDQGTLWPAARSGILTTARKRLDMIDEKLAALMQIRGEMATLIAGLEKAPRNSCPVADKRAKRARA